MRLFNNFLRGKFFLFIAFISLISTNIFASHEAGGEITYSCIGPNQYAITLTLYRDCGGISSATTYPLNYRSTACGVNASITLNRQNTLDITPLCPSQTSLCNGGSGTLGFERIIYTGVLNLPNGCSDWVLSTSSCCRNGAITNLNNPASQDIYIQTTLNNTVVPCNSSPTFSSNPQLFACVGQQVNYQQLATDPDGDVLVYSLINAMNAPGTSVTYAGGFNGTNPFTVPATIDPQTGQIVFTPNVPQVAVVAVLVQEYRGGVLIGSVMRDIQFNIVSCTNTIPALSGINNSPGVYSITTCVGAPLCFNVNATDPDAGQSVSMSISNSIPGSTFNQTGSGSSVSGTFCWTPGSDDVGTHYISVYAQDNACPLIGQNSQTYAITVIANPNPPVNAGPDVIICEGGSTTLTATTAATNISSFVWTPNTGLGSPNTASTTASPGSTTNYTVTLNYTDGCYSTDVVTVTVANAPLALVFPETANVCAGGTFMLSGTTNATGMNFQWFNPSMVPLGPGTVSGNGSTLSVTVPSTPGSYNYTLTVTDPVSGCSASDITTLVVGTPPALPSCVNIYASPTGNPTSSGTQANPTTLQNALALSQCNNAVIKLAIGTYNINNPLTIGSFVTIEGGFDPLSGWTKTSAAGATTINRTVLNPEGPVNGQRLVAFYANSVTGFRLQDLTVTTAAGTPGTGMSTYGLHLTNCSNYNIVRTQILPGAAGSGANGIAGTAGNPGRNGGTGSAGDIDDQEDSGGGGGGGGGGGTTLGNPGGNASGNFNAANNCTVTGGIGGAGGATAGAGGNGTGDTNGCGCCNAGTMAANGGTSTDPRSGGGGGGGGNGGCEDGGGGAGGLGGGVITVFGTNATGGAGGAEGVDGANGGNGAAGPAGAIGATGPVGSHGGGFWVPGTQAGTGTNGRGGQGGRGGGGGGGQGCTFCVDGCGSGGGGGGGGGQGGAGGTGGFGGGSSYGVYLLNNGAAGNLIQDRVIAGTAGAGGIGGAGGAGGAGGTGGAGSPYGGSEVGGGGNGGNGGAGGAGGAGGNGQPGQSFSVHLQSGTPLATNDNNFNLPGQPTITVSNVNCTNTNVTYSTGTPNAWDFDLTTNNATPATAGASSPVVTQYSTVARYSVSMGANTYTGFHNIAFAGGSNPVILTNAPQIGVDTYRLCVGDFASFQSQTFADTYVWNFNGAIPAPGNIQTVNAQFNTPGYYPITLSLITDCCGNSPTTTIYLYVLPNPNVTSTGNVSICEGNQTTLTVNGMTADNSVVWSPTTGIISSTANSITVAPTATTNYIATVTSFISSPTLVTGCPVTLNNTVTVNPTPVLSTSSTPVVCLNDGTATVNTSGGGTYNFTWSNGSSNLGATSSTINGLSAGTYSVTVTNQVTGCSNTADVLVYPSASQVQPVIVSNTPTCTGFNSGSVTVNSTGGTSPYTYLWNGTTNYSTNPVTINNLPAGIYSLSVTDGSGCQATISVDIPELPVPEYEVHVHGPICQGADAEFEVHGTDGAVLTYNLGSGNVNIVLSHDPLIIVVPNASGNVTMNVISISDDCVIPLTDSYTVVVNPNHNILQNFTICSGSNYTFPDGTVHSNITVDESYTSNLISTFGCDSIIVTNLSVQPAPNAGTNGTLTICEGSTVTAAQLFAQLGGTPDAGGTWSPALAGAGTYTYTVNATAPCTIAATAQVVVTEQAAPDAGTNGTLTICEGSTVTAAQLFAQLGGTPDAGGTWSPALAGAGTYTYTVNATAPCTIAATAQVVVTEQSAPDAGTNGTLTICEGSTVTAAQLFAQLGGTPDAGGTWSPALAGAGTYTYTVNATAPCTIAATAQVVVTEQAAPDAGTNGTLTICEGSTVTAAQLFAQLGGTPDAGGTWSPALAGAGTYTYTVNATAPCTIAATAQVVVTEQAAPDAGTNGTLTICEGSTVTAAQLFAQLGGTPDAGGTWSPALAGTGTYTYTVNATAPCTINATAQVVVTEQSAPDTGTNGTLTICEGSTVTAAQLFAQLGGTPDAGGTWSPALAGAGTYTYTVNATAPCTIAATAQVVVTEQAAPDAGTNGTLTICEGSTVTAAQLFSQLGGTPDAGGTWSPALAGAGTYTYTVNATAPCTIAATAQVVVTEQAAPDAGTNGTLTICEGSTVTAAQLFAQLGGTPDAGGTWSPALAGAGTYTYTVNATAPCTIDATAQVVVTEQAAPDAGTNGTLTICEGSTVTTAQLFAQLGGTPDAGGTWSPALAGAGTYTYTVNATAPCTIAATAQVVVTEQAAPDAGTNGTLTICEGSTVTAAQLFAQLGGTPDAGGTWSPALAGAGTYTYTVNATAPCTIDATAQVVVTEQSAPDAGTNGTLTICEGSTVTTAQLFAQLGGTPDAGGTWSPALAGAGTYTYTVNATAPCTIAATAQVVVTEQAAPDAGTNGTLTICEGSTVTAAQLFSQLVGTPDAGGTWSPALAGAGTYTYTVNATAPCTIAATAQVVVTEQAVPDAGTNGTLTICEGSTVTAAQLFAQLGGTPDAGGTWSPALAGAGTYTYTVNATAPCTIDATAQVVVNEQLLPANPVATVTQQPTCSQPNGQIIFTSPTGADIEYSINGTTYQVSPQFNNVPPGTYTLSVQTISQGCGSGTISVTVNPIPVTPAIPNSSSDTLYCQGDNYIDLWVSGGAGTFTWYSDASLTTSLGTGTTYPVIDQLGMTSYYITETVNDCVSEPAIINVVIDPCDTNTTIVIPSAFTPDGDNVNDLWDILFVDDVYPDNQVFVYNRWGNLIFESVKGSYSTSKWDGKYNDSSLPVASYYYMIYTNDDSKTIFKGTVSILKND